MEVSIIKEFFLLYGPLAIGWIAAGVMWWRIEKIIHDYHEAIVENTKVTERLAILISERTKMQRSR